MEFVQIGRVETPFDAASAAPRQGGDSPHAGNVRVRADFRDALRGLEHGDSVVVVWVAHEADRSVLRVRDGERGVFDTRSPARPNPVCITECDVLAVDEDDGTVAVKGVDMADGSPVLDLKRALD